MKEIWITLGPELKAHSKKLSLVILFGVFISLCKGAIPYLLGQLPGIWSSGNHTKAIYFPLMLGALWTASSILRYYHMTWMLYISELIAVNLRRKLMDKYLTLNLSFFSGFVRGSGGLISRMLNDIYIVQAGFQKVADLVREPISALLMSGYLIYVDWQLTLYIVAGMPIDYRSSAETCEKRAQILKAKSGSLEDSPNPREV